MAGYNYHKQSWNCSCKPTERYLTGAPHCGYRRGRWTESTKKARKPFVEWPANRFPCKFVSFCIWEDCRNAVEIAHGPWQQVLMAANAPPNREDFCSHLATVPWTRPEIFHSLAIEFLFSERTGCLMVESLSPPNQNFGKTIKKNPETNIQSHMLHVWNIYLHLGHLRGKCRYIFHTWSIWKWKPPLLDWVSDCVKKVAKILQLLPMMFPAFPSCKLPIYDDCHISFQKNY